LAAIRRMEPRKASIMSSLYSSSVIKASGFRACLAPFLQGPGLPFAEVLSEQEIAAAFTAEDISFGDGDEAIYTPDVTLWAFLSQMVFLGELRSCAAAVARVIVFLTSLGCKAPSADTGNYCRARRKLPESVLKRLVLNSGNRLESKVPGDWLWFGRHVKIADGTTTSMPDTEANQGVYPQSTAQKPGLGFPILRMMVVLSLTTAALCGLAFAPYAGKRTGESSLLRSLLDGFDPDDLVVGDRACGDYFILTLGRNRRIDWLVRLHQGRKIHYRRGHCRACYEERVTWQRPKCPKWMDQATYATIPETLTLRQIVIAVQEPGFRVDRIAVVCTLLDQRRYTAEDLAQLYRARWNIELDIRALKQSLGMEPLRTKTPEMIRKELWTHWLAYNLIRKVIAQAAQETDKRPRQISFAAARQSIAAAWDRLSREPQALKELAHVLWQTMAQYRVGHRPNRVEPRVVKRRPKKQRLMMKPRKELQAELLARKGRG
jgi:putative transposase